MELYTICWEKQSLVTVTTLLSLRVVTKKVPKVSEGEAMMLHQRLGHIGEKGLQSLQGKSMVEGMPKCNSDSDFFFKKYRLVFLEKSSMKLT